MIIGTVQQKDIRQLYISLINRAPKYRKNKLTELKREIHNFTVAVGYYHILQQLLNQEKLQKRYRSNEQHHPLDLTPRQRTVPQQQQNTHSSHVTWDAQWTQDRPHGRLTQAQLVQKGKGSHGTFCDHNKRNYKSLFTETLRLCK